MSESFCHLCPLSDIQYHRRRFTYLERTHPYAWRASLMSSMGMTKILNIISHVERICFLSFDAFLVIIRYLMRHTRLQRGICSILFRQSKWRSVVFGTRLDCSQCRLRVRCCLIFNRNMDNFSVYRLYDTAICFLIIFNGQTIVKFSSFHKVSLYEVIVSSRIVIGMHTQDVRYFLRYDLKVNLGRCILHISSVLK